MSECQKQLREQGKPYPRTCAVCGLFAGCKFDKVVTDKQAVPLLTRALANEFASDAFRNFRTYAAPDNAFAAAVLAIASGDAVVIPRITREALRRELGGLPQYDGAKIRSLDDIIAALKRLGVDTGQ